MELGESHSVPADVVYYLVVKCTHSFLGVIVILGRDMSTLFDFANSAPECLDASFGGPSLLDRHFNPDF